MFNPSRDQARRFLFDTWNKHRAQAPLGDLERMALAHLLAHPEYHALLEAPERHLDRDYAPAAGEANPFLHLSMHLAISEQLSIDQPPGIRAIYARLCARTGDEHKAAHRVMDCLAETIWRAQRNGHSPDSDFYLNCLHDESP